MKKKLISLFIALVAILSISFAFTACDKDSKGKMTEEEWVKAIDSSFSATNYTMSGETIQGQTITDWVHKCDLNNSLIYASRIVYSVQNNEDSDSESIKKEVYRIESYLEMVGSETYMYQTNGEVYVKDIRNFSTEEEAAEYLSSQNIMLALSKLKFGGVEEYVGQTATFAEIYSWLSYDISSDIYSAKISSLQSAPDSDGLDLTDGTVTFKFVKGKFSEVIIDGSYVQLSSEYRLTTTYKFKYGNAVIVIPEDIRNNAQARE